MALSEGQLIAEKYRIERLLGEGGMGAVYVATNTVLRREVALKVMTERFASVPEAVERFHREAIAASRVSHPSIVQVFDAGAHDGRPWIAMELLAGESLGDRLERGPLSLDETMTMATGALAALAEVHREGIVHRDLKPDNVFLSEVRGGTGFVPKVLDFGIAKDTSGEKLNKLTATGAVVGTAYYLSPEQAKGLSDIDARTDVYAMGVVLFECLSGRMPYEAETITQLIAKMFTETPPPLASVAPHVPAAVAHVVDTCLLAERDARFQSAEALLGALRAASEAGEVPAVAMAATAMGPAVGVAATGPLAIPGTMAGSPGYASAPGVAMPVAGSHGGASQPGFSSGAASHPGHHGASQPGVSHPGVSHPGVSHPGVSHPGVSHPGVSHPGVLTAPTPPMAGMATSAPPPAEASRSSVGLIVLVVGLFLLGAGIVGGAFFIFSGGDEAGHPVAELDTVEGIPAPAVLAPPDAPVEPPVADVPPAAAPATPTPTTARPEAPSPDTTEAPAPTPPVAVDRARRADTPSRAQAPTPPVERPTAPAPEPRPQPFGQRPPQPSASPQAAPPPRRRPSPARGLSPAEVSQTLNGRIEYINRRCYQRRVRRVPNLAGVVTLAFNVAPNGRTDTPQVVHNGTGDDWLARCTSNVVRSLRFPEARNGQSTPVRYPFQFRQGG